MKSVGGWREERLIPSTSKHRLEASIALDDTINPIAVPYQLPFLILHKVKCRIGYLAPFEYGVPASPCVDA
jgi:hypothetical protein